MTIFVAIFGIVYEHYSLGVYSTAMQYAWVFPLILGMLICLLFYVLPIKYLPGFLPFYIYNFGVAIWTFRSVFIGVIEIYGTTNELMVIIYTILGIASSVASVILYLVGLLLRYKDDHLQK
ncbi:MAG: hypothetical protein GX813_00315 [Erysipelotrichia bacterium]|nr:hypothetical protein [Erysipelotrichia bacterium]